MLAKTNAWEVSKVLFDASALVIKRKETKSFNVKLILVIVVAQDPTSLSVSFIVNLLFDRKLYIGFFSQKGLDLAIFGVLGQI